MRSCELIVLWEQKKNKDFAWDGKKKIFFTDAWDDVEGRLLGDYYKRDGE